MRKILLCIVFLLLATTLVAEDAVLRVGYISSFSITSLDDIVASSLRLVLSSHPSLSTLVEERISRTNERQYQEQVHKALENDNWDDIEKTIESAEVSTIEIVPISFEFWDKVALKKDEAEHIIRTENLDLLVSATGVTDSSLLDYILTLFTLDGEVEVLDSLAMIHLLNEEAETITKALSKALLPTFSYIKLENKPSNLVLYVDGEEREIINDMVFLSPGEHTISFSSINMVGQNIDVVVENEEILSLSLDFEPLSYPQLELVPIPSFARLNVQGMDGVAGYYFSQNQALPFAINSELPGFADLNVQVNTPLIASSIELKPEWMDNDKRMKNSKDEMYKALRNTILSFASYVLVSSLENIYPDEFGLYSAPLKLTFNSISIISLLDFLYKSGKYYHAAEQTYY